MLRIGNGVCELVCVAAHVCRIPSYIGILASGAADGVEKLLNATKEFFLVDVKTNVEASGNVNASKTTSQIVRQVKDDIFGRTSFILGITSLASQVNIQLYWA